MRDANVKLKLDLIRASLNLIVSPNKQLVMSSEEAVIDRIDLKILNVLQINGRISNLKLAESVALSPTALLADL